MEDQELKPFTILSAQIKEEVCNYSYEINTGIATGDKIVRKSAKTIHTDMVDAFAALNVHLAIIDDTFSSTPKKSKNLEEMENHKLTASFNVTGFKVQGTEENEGFVLIGDKWVSHGTISLETPKINKASGYAYYDELKEAMERARYEVELYMGGKAAPQPEQAALAFPDHAEDGAFETPMK